MRILLVEDSGTMRMLVRFVLRQLGHTEVEEARDGREAMDKLGAFTPDLLLVDLSMPGPPGMDGLSFVRTLRQSDNATPIILITAESERSRVAEAIEAGANGCVTKPFTPDQLGRRLGEALEKAAA